MHLMSAIPKIGVPRLPLVPDIMRRARIPADLEAVTTRGEEDDPTGVGMTVDAVESVWDAVVDVYRGGAHPAIQLCVRREGQVVLNRAIGHASGNGPDDKADVPKTLATTNTPFCLCSASKAITAVVVHLLAERGELSLDDTVAQHIPEFARHGKGGITIGHLLSHRAGIPRHPAATMDLDHLDDREAIVRAVSDTRPDSAPGTRMAYHAVMGGTILGEIVHRVAGRDIRAVLTSEVLEPLGLRWTNYGVDPLDVPAVGLSYLTGPPTPPPLSTLLGRVLGTSLEETVRKINDPRFLTGVVPSGNVVTTADEFSQLFEMLRRGGELGGVRVLRPETVANAVRSETPLEVDYSLGVPLRYGKGFMLGEKRFSLFGPDTENVFGHLGFSNILGWADPDRALSVGLITSGKPVYYPEVFGFLGLMRRIGAAAPRSSSRDKDSR